MRPDQFYESRQADWKTLTQLLDRSQDGVRQFSSEDVNTLGRLYRAATSDLALAQRDFPSHQVTAYLNQLVARAHTVVYRGEPMARRRLLRFVTTGFPRIYRETFPFILVAALLFIIPALAAGLGTAWQPEAAKWLLPAQAHNLIPIIEGQELWTDIPIHERPFASSFIMQNNIQVAFMAFGSGVLAGLPTVWIMIFNGLLIGGITGLTAYHGLGFDLWTFVIGHGVIELSMIFIAGGSGLMLGWAVVRPGLLSRRDALTIAARKAVRLVIGCVPLLIIAGLIEGFVSPAENIPWQIKWGVGLGSGLLLYSYLLFSGREQRPNEHHRSIRPFSSK
ncbi:MAG: stage II sporulation protein M [Chloroflexi bacterium]|nr:stage II sporulation protein M [Chloroflexota bacterium]